MKYPNPLQSVEVQLFLIVWGIGTVIHYYWGMLL